MVPGSSRMRIDGVAEGFATDRRTQYTSSVKPSPSSAPETVRHASAPCRAAGVDRQSAARIAQHREATGQVLAPTVRRQETVSGIPGRPDRSARTTPPTG